MRKKWTLEILQEEVKKYKTRSEFQKNNKGAYLSAMRKKLLDELFKNHKNNGYSTKRKPDGYWTKEKLQEEVNKYKTRSEFSKNNPSLYSIIQKHKWYNDLFSKHENSGYSIKQKPLNYWNYENVQEEANKYKTRYDFRQNSPDANSYAEKNNLINKLFSKHFNEGYLEKKHKNGYWNYEKVQEEANKYKTRSELQKYNNAAYIFARKNNLLNDIFKLHVNNGFSLKQHQTNYWNYEKIFEVSKKYDTLKDFIKYDYAAYRAGLRRKLIDVFFNEKQNKYLDNNFNCKYVIYVYEIHEYNKCYVGLTKHIKIRDRQHLFNFKEPLNKFCKEKNISLPKYKLLNENLSSSEAVKQERYWIDYYKNNNWDLINIAKGGSLGGGIKKWSKKYLFKEMKKYNTMDELKKNSVGVYSAIRRLNVLQEINEYYKNKKSE
jgi:hypothetical protein